MGLQRLWMVLWSVLVGSALVLVAAGAAVGATLDVNLVGATGESGILPEGVVRAANGSLHLVYATKLVWSDSADGVAATSISPSGHLGPTVQALSTWNTGVPGLVVLPSGALEAVFGGGATNGSTGSNAGPWGIVSNDGGATWSSPADVGSGLMEVSAADITAHLVAGAPVLTVPQPGGLVIQSGFGNASPTFQLNTPPSVDGYVGNVDAAVDAATGDLVASWKSAATPGGLWLQRVAPSVGSAQKAPGPVNVGAQQQLVVTGRDTGPGVYGAYTPDSQSQHVRLLRYGGGSVAVGRVKGMSASALGVATGLDGRIWVMWWGTLNGKGVIAITRSNKAVTRFEPIQRYTLNSEYMWRLYGDGRLGPLDLLVNEAPIPPNGQKLINGIYHARVLPRLSATTAVKQIGKTKFKLTVKVTDAGDPVSGATVKARGQQHKTNKQGVAVLKVIGSSGSHVTETVTDAGYQMLSQTVKL